MNRYLRPDRLQWLSNVHPASFAPVMATGIVAIACDAAGLKRLGQILAGVNIAIFAASVLIAAGRAVLFPGPFKEDLRDHNRGVGFFTEVAGTAVFGSGLYTMFGLFRAPLILWFVSMVLWLFFTYAIFAAFILKPDKPSLSHGIHGGWLLAVVATEAIAQLGLLLLPKLPGRHLPVLFLSLVLWLFGGMLYIWMISLIFYRYTFFVILPADFMPFYWIDMGAMAIASLVGARLLERTIGSSLADLAPFIKGFTILFWATATWWIPMLIIFAVWRHAVAREAFDYSPFYWGAVFPLGMYAVATFRLVQITHLDFLRWIPEAFTWIALSAWVATFIGLLRSLLRQLPLKQPQPPGVN